MGCCRESGKKRIMITSRRNIPARSAPNEVQPYRASRKSKVRDRMKRSHHGVTSLMVGGLPHRIAGFASGTGPA